VSRQHANAAVTTRGRLVALLQRGPVTVDQLAGALGLTRNAVRAQLAVLERDGVVEQRQNRPGVRKPSFTYGLTAAAALSLSRAYVPLLVELVGELRGRMSEAELEGALQQVGRRLAGGQLPGADVRARVEGAGAMLDALGGATEVRERDGVLEVRGYGCPLAAVTAGHPAVCRGVEAMVSEWVGAPVAECCERGPRPSCRFAVRPPAA
jgi:predicted ArsR family transcriptional regulator